MGMSESFYGNVPAWIFEDLYVLQYKEVEILLLYPSSTSRRREVTSNATLIKRFPLMHDTASLLLHKLLNFIKLYSIIHTTLKQSSRSHALYLTITCFGAVLCKRHGVVWHHLHKAADKATRTCNTTLQPWLALNVTFFIGRVVNR
jgi:hypothetical protein